MDSNDTTRDPKTRERFEESGNLDLLRAFAVSCVVLSHALPLIGISPKGYHLGALGLLGVLLFFVHTSLVLMLSLSRLQRRGTRSLFGTFMKRRALRIYPLSVVVVLATWALDRAGLGPEAPVRARVLLANLALVQNLTGDPSVPGPLWTLPLEMQMYLLLPSLYLMATKRRVWPWLVGWLAVCITVLAIRRVGLDINSIKYIPCFLPGVIAFVRRDTRARLPSFALPVLLLTLGLVYPVLVARGARENALGPFVCLVLGLLLPHIREIAVRPVARVAQTIAKYSYGIYLLHGYLLWLTLGHAVTLPLVVRFALFFVTLGLASYAAFHLIERPAIAFGAREPDRRPGPQRATVER